MTEPIRGKVARVINKREVALNVGAAAGVTVGMHFDILEPRDVDIKDPDSGKVLGSFYRPKVRVKITQVEEELSLATTYRGKQVNIEESYTGPNPLSGLLTIGPIARALMPPNWVMKYENLGKTSRTADTLNEEDSRMKTGDAVVQVIEPDEEAPDETARN